MNAYHQPGVEAGKKTAASILALQGKVLAAEQIANTVDAPDAAETVYLLLEYLAANGRARYTEEDGPGQIKFSEF